MSENFKCPFCGETIPSGSVKCPMCGEQLPVESAGKEDVYTEAEITYYARNEKYLKTADAIVRVSIKDGVFEMEFRNGQVFSGNANEITGEFSQGAIKQTENNFKFHLQNATGQLVNLTQDNFRGFFDYKLFKGDHRMDIYSLIASLPNVNESKSSKVLSKVFTVLGIIVAVIIILSAL